MRRYQTSDSPFYDKEFLNRKIPRRNGTKRRRPTPEPHQLATWITCRDCLAPARIQHFPAKTTYRCTLCNTLLATMNLTAEVHIP